MSGWWGELVAIWFILCLIWREKGVETMQLHTEEQDGVLIIRFTDAKIMDESRVVEIRKAMLALLDEPQSSKMVLSFAGVCFMSAALIGVLSAFERKRAAQEIRLYLSDISPNVMEVFKITRMHKCFEIVPTLEEAIKKVNKKRGWFG